MSHVRGYTYNRKTSEQLTYLDTLNSKVDKLISSKATAIVSTHIFNTLISVYINYACYPNKYHSVINPRCDEYDT